MSVANYSFRASTRVLIKLSHLADEWITLQVKACWMYMDGTSFDINGIVLAEEAEFSSIVSTPPHGSMWAFVSDARHLVGRIGLVGVQSTLG